jgi:hypothetical protein
MNSGSAGNRGRALVLVMTPDPSARSSLEIESARGCDAHQLHAHKAKG